MRTKGETGILELRRRPSRLGAMLHERKLVEARRLTPSERLRIALELSDLCRELRQACLQKRFKTSSGA